jgi:MFS family permease
MMSLATFGVGFLMRPLGGIIIGQFADRRGRKPAMTMSLWLMALGSAIFIVAPTYAQIGLAAPLLMIAGRMIQGFAVGGEVGASTSMLLEYADDSTRGFYSSWQLFSQALSTLVGSGVGLLLTYALSTEQLEGWGWRLPFVVGLLLVPIGNYIRRFLEETGEVEEAPQAGARTKHAPCALGEILRAHRAPLLLGTAIVIGGTSANYIVMHYITTYAKAILHMPFSLALWASWVAGLLQLLLCAPAGILSDSDGVHLGVQRGHDVGVVPPAGTRHRPGPVLWTGRIDLRWLLAVHRHLAGEGDRLQPRPGLVCHWYRAGVAGGYCHGAGDGGAKAGLINFVGAGLSARFFLRA